MIVIRGGEVLTPEGWKIANVAIDGEMVVAVGSGLAAETEVDARGCIVGPGFVDMHTHLREPGHTWKEDVSSGAATAAAGGFTAITAMPNTDPPVDTPKVVESVRTAADEVGAVDVVVSAALTEGRAGASATDVDALYDVGVRLFTDDGDSVADPALLEEAMAEIAAHPGAFVAQHAEDVSMTDGRHIHEGAVSRSLGIHGMPDEAEAGIVRRDLELAQRTGVHYHCQHVSAAMTVDLIRAAKESGMPVTAEVTPHHLTFDETSLLTLDPDFKMYPPLRSDLDRRALIEGLKDGTIDVVATDHAPHRPEEKDVAFERAPRGVIGLETAASATWEVVEDRNLLFRSMSTRPAQILGLSDHGHPLHPGVAANLVVFDPESRWTASTFVSRSSNSPYRGRAMKGRVRTTIHGGRVVYSQGSQTS